MLAPRMPSVPLASPMKRRRTTRDGSNFTTSSVVTTVVARRASGVKRDWGPRSRSTAEAQTCTSSMGVACAAGAAARVSRAAARALCLGLPVCTCMMPSPVPDGPGVQRRALQPAATPDHRYPDGVSGIQQGALVHLGRMQACVLRQTVAEVEVRLEFAHCRVVVEVRVLDAFILHHQHRAAHV